MVQEKRFSCAKWTTRFSSFPISFGSVSGRRSFCGVGWSWIIEGKEKILLRRKWNCYGSQQSATQESRARKIASPTSRAIVFSSRATKMHHRPARRATLNTGLPRNVPYKLHTRGRAEEIMCRSHAKICWESHLIECQ